MKKKIFKLAAVSALMLIFSAAGIAQQAHDQYGFGNRVFLIQSAPEVGKSANGLWDIPGAPKKTDGNLKGSKWQHMGLWQREAGDPEDRLFRFRAAQGSAAGRYFIYVGRSGHWGVNAIDGTGKIEARSRADHFELKHMGNGRWKIYYKNGMIVAPSSRSSKNGTKLMLLPDQNSPHVQWVFFDTATNRSFVPASTSTSGGNYSYKGKLEDAIASKHPGEQYFRYAAAAQFNSENEGNKLQAYLNDKSDTSDQWVAILNIVKAVKSNKDTGARRSMYKAVSEANVKKGSNFAENLLKGQYVKQIRDIERSEKDAAAKRYLSTLVSKY
jgi:hypothetical protein